MPDSSDTTTRMVPVNIDPCLEKRENGEPMFILLARDSTAPIAMDMWCGVREHEIETGRRPDTPQEHEHIAQVRQKVEEFETWRKKHRRFMEADQEGWRLAKPKKATNDAR